MGNTVHRTLPGTPGAAPQAGAERSLFPEPPRPRSPGAPESLAAGARTPEPHPCGLVRTPPGPPGLGRAPRAFVPARGRGGANRGWGGGHRGFPWPEPPGGLRDAGVLGLLAQPAGAPATRATSWRRSHARRAAPRSGVRSAGGCPAPSEPLLRGAHRPLVKSALEFPRPRERKGGGRGALGVRAEEAGDATPRCKYLAMVEQVSSPRLCHCLSAKKRPPKETHPDFTHEEVRAHSRRHDRLMAVVGD